MRLAVILPIYNAEKYLAECLDSLLEQTFTDFCILAIDDASTDSSGEILKEYAQKDRRIWPFHFAQNSGDPAATQFAFDILRYMQVDYIARMDADDICFPQRFEKQIYYLDEHAEIDVLGTNMLSIAENGTELGMTDVPLQDADIKANLILARANILNPTAMWRNETVRKLDIRYNITETACDYAMWVQLAIHRKRFANLAEVLVKYRLHPNQASKKVELIKRSAHFSLSHYFTALFPKLTLQESEALAFVCNGIQISLSVEQYVKALQVIDKISNEKISVLGENRNKVLECLLSKAKAIRQTLLQYAKESSSPL